MSIAIRYYTRGGNTKKLADAIQEELGVEALDVFAPLKEKVDILFLGCSYYAFDMDANVKNFIADNKDKIGKVVLFGTSAMMKSMKKPFIKLFKNLGVDIELAEDEYHCPGSFGIAHKGRPNEQDLLGIRDFANKFK